MGQKEKGLPDAAGQAPKENNLLGSIPHVAEESKGEILQDIVRSGKAKICELTDIVRNEYPGMTRDLMRKCLLPEEYGVELTDRAMKLLGRSPKLSRAARRRLQNRVTFRVNDAEYAKLQAQITATGDTMQSLMYRVFLDFLNGVPDETPEV